MQNYDVPGLHHLWHTRLVCASSSLKKGSIWGSTSSFRDGMEASMSDLTRVIPQSYLFRETIRKLHSVYALTWIPRNSEGHHGAKEKTEIEIWHVYLRSIPGAPITLNSGNPDIIQNYPAIKATSFKDLCLYVLFPFISVVQVIAMIVKKGVGVPCTLRSPGRWFIWYLSSHFAWRINSGAVFVYEGRSCLFELVHEVWGVGGRLIGCRQDRQVSFFIPFLEDVSLIRQPIQF